MIIRNRTRKTLISRETEVARSIWKKTIGLMFRKGIEDGRCLLMEFGDEGQNRHSIWMAFMRFPIDLIFLDSHKVVTDTHEGISPLGFRPGTWRLYKPSRPVKWVIEAAEGWVKKTGTRKGDKIDF